MSIKIITNEVIIPCFRQLNLLAHAQMAEIDIGSKCGGHGVCGKDRIQISEKDQKKLSPLTDIERKFLSEEEIQNGYRLGCQCWPNEDHLSIEITILNRSS